MNYEQIETFLLAVSLNSITAAAEALFISQPTASNRIHALEEELGTTLLFRGKGQRNIELTAHGKAFVPIANQWSALWRDTQNIKSLPHVQPLTVAAPNVVNTFTLLPFYQQFIEQYPNIKLYISTRHTGEVHSLVQNRIVDVGLAYQNFHHSDIESRPIYRDPLCLICHKDSAYYAGIHPEALRAEDEVFQFFGPEYQAWHDKHWDPHVYHVLTVDTGTTLPHYLNHPSRWAIATQSMARALTDHSDLVAYPLEDAPPPLVCYELVNKYPKQSHAPAIELFQQELERFVSADQDICS